jgi:hypothetical protein
MDASGQLSTAQVKAHLRNEKICMRCVNHTTYLGKEICWIHVEVGQFRPDVRSVSWNDTCEDFEEKI